VTHSYQRSPTFGGAHLRKLKRRNRGVSCNIPLSCHRAADRPSKDVRNCVARHSGRINDATGNQRSTCTVETPISASGSILLLEQDIRAVPKFVSRSRSAPLPRRSILSPAVACWILPSGTTQGRHRAIRNDGAAAANAAHDTAWVDLLRTRRGLTRNRRSCVAAGRPGPSAAALPPGAKRAADGASRGPSSPAQPVVLASSARI
jgi:hypothetical protein